MGKEGDNEHVLLDVLLDGPTIDEIDWKSEMRSRNCLHPCYSSAVQNCYTLLNRVWKIRIDF